MKNVLIFLLVAVLVGCNKEEVLISDFIDGVPDARFAGIWYDSENRRTRYEFSIVNNEGKYFVASATGGPLIAYSFYWRKSATTGKFEIKRDFGDKVWSDFELEFIDINNIKIESKKFTK